MKDMINGAKEAISCTEMNSKFFVMYVTYTYNTTAQGFPGLILGNQKQKLQINIVFKNPNQQEADQTSSCLYTKCSQRVEVRANKKKFSEWQGDRLEPGIQQTLHCDNYSVPQIHVPL